MSSLNTTNPIVLQVLMSETIFAIDFAELNVESSTVPTPIEETKIVLKSFGENKRNILFITEDLNHDFFSKDAELAFVKTLGALKLNLDDVAVINYTRIGSAVTFDQIKKNFEPKACVFLGLDPKKLHLSNCAANILTNDQNIQFLYSYSFEEMLTDTSKKRIFWEAIKLLNT